LLHAPLKRAGRARQELADQAAELAVHILRNPDVQSLALDNRAFFDLSSVILPGLCHVLAASRISISVIIMVRCAFEERFLLEAQGLGPFHLAVKMRAMKEEVDPSIGELSDDELALVWLHINPPRSSRRTGP